MTEAEKDKALQDQQQAIIGLGQMVIELFLTVYALEAILQERGLLSVEDVDKMAQQMQVAFSSLRTSPAVKAQLNSLEEQKQRVLERLRELLLRFEGPIQ